MSNSENKPIKVVHVHFLHGRKNYYFGSVRAIYKKFSEEELGVSESYVRHQLNSDGRTYLNDKVFIFRSHLLR